MSGVFFVVPGVPVGKGRPKFARRGNFVATYTPAKTASYENLVKLAAHTAMRGKPPIEGPVRLELKMFVPAPASWSRKKRELALGGAVLPTTKPDIDNVLKGICDAMNGVVFLDDKQVCEVSVTKRYAATPEVAVHVAEMSFIEAAA